MTQEQEQEYKEKIGSPEMEHLQYLMENPTPTLSDTFIEDWENVSTFDYLYLYNPELKNYTSCGVSMKSFIKQRLLQQRQEIEREIDKLSFENGEDWGEGKSEKLVWLEDIKALLK